MTDLSSSPASVDAAPSALLPSGLLPSAMLPTDEAAVQALHAHVFGPGRFVRTAFRLREKAAPLAAYSFVWRERGHLVGAVSMSRIAVGDAEGSLLGPLAVLPDKRDLGVGKALLLAAVQAAFAAGEPYVLLVGDLPYYASAGFARAPFGQIILPGPVDPARLLIALNPSGDGACPVGKASGSS